MADIPIKRSRRWQDYKFRYTQDDGTDIITSDRISLNDDGSYILSPTPMLESRKVTDPALKKAKFWGKPENLRKVEITYAEPNNVDGRSETRRYNPYPPFGGCLDYVKEVTAQSRIDLPESCVSYRGENRFTLDKPQRIRDLANQVEPTI